MSYDTLESMQIILKTAQQQAYKAAKAYMDTHMDGEDRGACGFAWVNIYDIKGNTRLGKLFQQAGVTRDHTRTLCVWNPAQIGVQSVDVLLVGAQRYAEVLRHYGFNATARSRLD